MMRVEMMTLADLDAVAELATQLGYPRTAEEIRERFAEIDGQATHALFVVRTGAGAVIGWVQVNRERESLLSPPRAEIGGLVVNEAHRARGIGKMLLGAAEEWARAQGLAQMRVRSNVLRRDAHRFYEREGYRVEKSWHLLVKELG